MSRPRPRLETTVDLPDGRRLGVVEYGPARGRPVVWFHGTPGGGRQIPPPLVARLADLGVRLLAVERPGYGRSTPHTYRAVGDVTGDVEHLLDGLGIDRYGVAALSGGGPYALALAHAHPERVAAAAVLGGVAPHAGEEGHPGGLVGALAPLRGVAAPLSGPVGRLFQGVITALTPVASTGFDLATRFFPPGDRAVFADPAMKAMFIDDIVRTARGGLPGPALDLRLFLADWGFRLADVGVPVRFWHGDADPIVTTAQAEGMAGRVAGATLTVRPGESHLGGFAVADEAVAWIVARW